MSECYKYPDLMPGETFSAYVKRAGKEYVKWRMTEQELPKEACLAEYNAFIESEKARLDSNIKRLLRSHKLDPRELYLIPTIFYNYTTLVPYDYEVNFDNIENAEKRLSALIAEHKALDAERNRYLRLPPDEQRRYVLVTLLYAPVDPKVAELPVFHGKQLEVDNTRAMEARKAAAEACIELLIDKITSVKKHSHYEKKAAIAKENSDESVIKLRLRAKKLRSAQEKEARLDAQRAERTRVMAERNAMLIAQRAERLRFAREKEARIAAEKAERRRLAHRREERKAEYNRLVAEQIEAKKKLKEARKAEQEEANKLKMQKELKKWLKNKESVI